MKTSAVKAYRRPSAPIQLVIVALCASISSTHARNAATARDKTTCIHIGVDS